MGIICWRDDIRTGWQCPLYKHQMRTRFVTHSIPHHNVRVLERRSGYKRALSCKQFTMFCVDTSAASFALNTVVDVVPSITAALRICWSVEPQNILRQNTWSTAFQLTFFYGLVKNMQFHLFMYLFVPFANKINTYFDCGNDISFIHVKFSFRLSISLIHFMKTN